MRPWGSQAPTTRPSKRRTHVSYVTVQHSSPYQLSLLGKSNVIKASDLIPITTVDFSMTQVNPTFYRNYHFWLSLCTTSHGRGGRWRAEADGGLQSIKESKARTEYRREKCNRGTAFSALHHRTATRRKTTPASVNMPFSPQASGKHVLVTGMVYNLNHA